jgi:glycine cleavage system aminomethyltransferase T
MMRYAFLALGDIGLHPFMKLERRGFKGKDATLARSRENPGWRMMLFSVDTPDTDVLGLHPVLLDGE